jgi:Thioesterase-like superfamily
MTAQSIFMEQDGCFVPTELARGPWDQNALHGGAAAALIVDQLERLHPAEGLRTGRLSFQFLRPIPSAPLTLTTSVTRPGRRVQELSAELRAGDQLVCRAKALRVPPVSAGLPQPADRTQEDTAPGDKNAASGDDAVPQRSMPPPKSRESVRFALDDPDKTSFATAMEMRWLTEPFALGPGRVWMRLRHPLLPDRSAGPLSLLAAVADFGNGVSSELPFRRYLFINADLTIHLQRVPAGEWAGIDARTLLRADGPALAESVVHDREGPVGRAFQTLVVQAR